MHEQEAEAQGLRCIYKLIDLPLLGLGAEALPDLLRAAELMGFAGVNITHPCKQAVIPFLHELSPDAQALGAVNTVLLRAGRRIGHNTDCSGFAENFRRFLPHVAPGRVVQLGAGGAGSAVAQAILSLGARQLTIFDIDRTRAETLAAQIGARFPDAAVQAGTALAPALAQADGLINTTPVGMVDHPGLPVPKELLRPALWVADIVYFPLETELLRTSRALGCRTLDGGGMAVFQAVHAFQLFTGLTPDAERMRAHFVSMTE